MINYFIKKIGEKLYQGFVTGETFFTKVYERRYTFEIITAKPGVLQVKVKSKDVTPSGFGEGGSDKNFGCHNIKFKDTDMLDDILKGIAKQVDPQFFREYSDKIR